MTTRYTLRTETKPNLAQLTSELFIGATLQPGKGLYNGQLEDSTAIIIIGDAGMLPSVRSLAALICKVNAQECVLLEVDTLSRPAELITAEAW